VTLWCVNWREKNRRIQCSEYVSYVNTSEEAMVMWERNVEEEEKYSIRGGRKRGTIPLALSVISIYESWKNQWTRGGEAWSRRSGDDRGVMTDMWRNGLQTDCVFSVEGILTDRERYELTCDNWRTGEMKGRSESGVCAGRYKRHWRGYVKPCNDNDGRHVMAQIMRQMTNNGKVRAKLCPTNEILYGDWKGEWKDLVQAWQTTNEWGEGEEWAICNGKEDRGREEEDWRSNALSLWREGGGGDQNVCERWPMRRSEEWQRNISMRKKIVWISGRLCLIWMIRRNLKQTMCGMKNLGQHMRKKDM